MLDEPTALFSSIVEADPSVRRMSSAGAFWKTNEVALTWSIFDGTGTSVSQGLIENKKGRSACEKMPSLRLRSRYLLLVLWLIVRVKILQIGSDSRGEMQQFARGSTSRDLRRFARSTQSVIKPFDGGVITRS